MGACAARPRRIVDAAAAPDDAIGVDVDANLARAILASAPCLRTRSALAQVSRAFAAAARDVASLPATLDLDGADAARARAAARSIDDAIFATLPRATLENVLRARPLELERRVALFAAFCGRVDLLKTLRRRGVALDADVCAAAATGGRADVLAWLVEREGAAAAWDVRVCALAARHGHLDVLQYAIERDCPCDASHVRVLAREGMHTDVVSCLRVMGVWTKVPERGRDLVRRKALAPPPPPPPPRGGGATSTGSRGVAAGSGSAPPTPRLARWQPELVRAVALAVAVFVGAALVFAAVIVAAVVRAFVPVVGVAAVAAVAADAAEWRAETMANGSAGTAGVGTTTATVTTAAATRSV